MTPTTAPRALLWIPFAASVLSGCTAGVVPTITAVSSSTSPPAVLDSVFVASDSWAQPPAGVFELFSVGASSQASRLTFCSGCQAVEAAPSRDRTRVALRRVTTDTNGDRRLNELDRISLLLVDLARQIEGPFLPGEWSTSSVDWVSDGTFLVHASSPAGGLEDLYQIEANAKNNQSLLTTPNVRERGARVNPAISRVVYERIEGAGPGRSEIWIFASSVNQTKLTDSGITGELLPSSLYLVGSDAGPAYSPDGNSVVFRRLTSNSVPGGAWDILTVPITGGAPRVIVSGPQFRSNPDWSKDGILFSEANPTSGGSDIVAIDPATGARRVVQAFRRGVTAGAPRWIAGTTG